MKYLQVALDFFVKSIKKRFKEFLSKAEFLLESSRNITRELSKGFSDASHLFPKKESVNCLESERKFELIYTKIDRKLSGY